MLIYPIILGCPLNRKEKSVMINLRGPDLISGRSLGFDPITFEQLVQIMWETACAFLEYYNDCHMNYYRHHGYVGPDPVRFKPSLADKMLLRQMIFECAKKMPQTPNIYCGHSAIIFGERFLFDEYYPQFDRFNRQQSPE